MSGKLYHGSPRRYGLRNDVKVPEEPKSLTKAISRAVRCDNRLSERRSEHQFEMPSTRSEPTYASFVAKTFPRESFNATPSNTPTPMEIDTTCHRGPLSKEEKHRHRENRLCLYCRGPGHIVVNYPHRPRRQVNHINVSTNSTKPETISIESQAQHRPDRLNKPRTGSVGTGRFGRVRKPVRKPVRNKAGSVWKPGGHEKDIPRGNILLGNMSLRMRR